jgi:hypothetical protein
MIIIIVITTRISIILRDLKKCTYIVG